MRIGFVWDPCGQRWGEGFAALMQFKQREGYYRAYRAYQEGDHKLGSWVRVQRRKKTPFH